MSTPPPRKVLKNEVSRFCDETGVNGFAYAKQAHCLEERCLWIIATGIFFGIMTLFLCYQFAEYYESPTVTNVEIQYPNNVELPSPTVCVQVNISAMEDQFDEGRWTHIVRSVRDNYALIKKSPYFSTDFNTTLLGLNQDCYEAKCAYSEDFRKWLVLMTGYISETVKLESFIQGERGNLTFEDIRKIVAPAKVKSYVGVTREIEKHIESLKSEWNLSSIDIIKVVGAAICRIIDIRLKKDVFRVRNGRDFSFNYTYPCTVDRITWLGSVPAFGDYKEVLCISLANLPMFNFTSRSDSVAMFAAPLNLYKKDDWLKLEKVRSYGIFMKPGGERVFLLDVDSQNILRIPAHSLSHVPSEITGVYQAYPTKRGCTDGDTPVLECLQRCRVSAYLRLCGCFPMTHFSMDHPAINSSQICTIPRLTNASKVGPDCLELTKLNSNDSDCESECNPPCKVQIFKFKRVPYRRSKLKLTRNESSGFLEVEGDVLKPYTKSILNFQQFSYPLYTEIWKKELIDLISDTGNVAGLWLGASLLAMIHVIVYVLVVLFDCVLANRVSSLPSRNSWILCYRDQHKHLSQSKKLHIAGADIRSDLGKLLNTVASSTAALKHRIGS